MSAERRKRREPNIGLVPEGPVKVVFVPTRPRLAAAYERRAQRLMAGALAKYYPDIQEALECQDSRSPAPTKPSSETPPARS